MKKVFRSARYGSLILKRAAEPRGFVIKLDCADISKSQARDGAPCYVGPLVKMKVDVAIPRLLSGKPRAKFSRGFSLIELTAVLALMALLATFVTLSVRHVMVKSKQNAARSQIAALRDAVEKYYLDTGHYPTNDQGLAILTTPPGKKADPLLRNIPLDPWTHPYVYLSPGKSEPYEIISLGADGREGGDGADADISSADAPVAGEAH